MNEVPVFCYPYFSNCILSGKTMIVIILKSICLY